MQLIGIGSVIIIAWLTLRLSTFLPNRETEKYNWLARPLTFLLVLTYYPLVYMTIMGMETGLLTILLLGSMLFVVSGIRGQDERKLLAAAALLGLAYLTRPDAIIPAALIFTYVFLMSGWMTWRRRLVLLLQMGGILALFGIGYQIFRWNYYGEMLPNTYTLKVAGMPMAVRLRNGLAFVQPFLKEHSVILIVVTTGLLLNFHQVKLFWLAIAAALTAYQVWVGGDISQHWRIISPAMPLVLAIFVQDTIIIARRIANAQISQTLVYRILRGRKIAAAQVAELARAVPVIIIGLVIMLSAVGADYVRISQMNRPGFGRQQTILLFIGILFVLAAVPLRRFAPLLLIGALTVTSIAFINNRYTVEIIMQYQPHMARFHPDQVNTAIILNEVTAADATVGVIWAGIIPFYTDRVAIDFLGKADPVISRAAPDLSGAVAWWGMSSVPGHNKYDLDYSIKELQPTYVQQFAWGAEDVTEWAAGVYDTISYKGLELHLRKDSEQLLCDVASFAQCAP